MLFSSIPFLYYFLPVFFILYFLIPSKARNIVLLVMSLVFYFYKEGGYVLLLLLSSVLGFLFGILVDKYRNNSKKSKTVLTISIIFNLLILGFFKYSDFFILNLNTVLGTSIPPIHIHLPLGISFYTFQTIGYIVDVYKGEAEPLKNPFNFATYVTMFPQLVAGPIVRYTTVKDEIGNRKLSADNFAAGATRFVIGLGKKVLIADTLSELNSISSATGNKSVLFYWIIIISFMLQIYFDFSGYSDMAIGLGCILGFNFLENFNYPFISGSVSEFWQRWHISMGSWFREYIYIPLGGNRVNKLKWIRNIAVVWFVTGLWHGASWNYILWGVYFGVILVVEKLLLSKILDKTPAIIRCLYTLIIVTFSFVIFRLENIKELFEYLKGMLGLLYIPAINRESMYYLKSYAVVLLVAVIGATPLFKNLILKIKEQPWANKVINILTPIFNVALLLLVTAFLVDSSFNPFLYFRF